MNLRALRCVPLICWGALGALTIWFFIMKYPVDVVLSSCVCLCVCFDYTVPLVGFIIELGLFINLINQQLLWCVIVGNINCDKTE
jgi:hypothetical protein